MSDKLTAKESNKKTCSSIRILLAEHKSFTISLTEKQESLFAEYAERYNMSIGEYIIYAATEFISEEMEADKA